MNAIPPKAAKENGTGEPSSQSASGIAQRSRLRRTLLFAGVFGLLAMIYVPKPTYHSGSRFYGGGYRLVFDQSNTGVALSQLLVNVVFAAALGAIAANIPKPTKRVLIAIIGGIAIVAGVIGSVSYVNYYRLRADAFQQNAAIISGRGDNYWNAERYYRKAAENYRLALFFEDLAAQCDKNAEAANQRARYLNEVEPRLIHLNSLATQSQTETGRRSKK